MDYQDKGHTITVAYSVDLLRQLWETIKQIRGGKLTRGVLFHLDNALAHTSTVTTSAIQKYGFELVEDPPYSPDLPPSDYYLFPKMKSELDRHHFVREDYVINAVDHFPNNENGTYYIEGIHLLHDCWTVS